MSWESDADRRQEEQEYLESLPAILDKLTRAAEAVSDWYNRDGTVGGAVDPMAMLDEALGRRPTNAS